MFVTIAVDVVVALAPEVKFSKCSREIDGE